MAPESVRVTFRVAVGLLVLLLVPAPARGQDLTGPWRFRAVTAVVERGLSCLAGTVSFDRAGVVTTGQQHACDESAAAPLGGGRVAIGVNGMLDGTIGTLTVGGALSTAGNTFVTVLGGAHASSSGLGVFVKSTAATYEASDLAGTWRVRLLAGGPAPAEPIEIAAGTIDIAASGAIIGGALTFSDTLASVRGVVGGTAAISADGGVTATVLTLDGASTLTTTVDGLMSPDKAVIGATLSAGEATGPGLALLQRQRPAVFAPADLAGQWTAQVFVTEDGDDGLALSGILDIEASGAVTGALRDALGTLTPVSGAATLDARGALALDGLALGRRLTVDGTLADSKAYGAGTVTMAALDPSGRSALGLLSMVRHDVPASTVQFAAPTDTVREGAAAATVMVTRSGALGAAASVAYRVSGDGASSPAAGTLTFAPHVATQTITLPLPQNRVSGAERRLDVALWLAAGARLGTPATTQIVLGDDDQPGSFRLDAGSHTVLETAPSVEIGRAHV